MSSTSTILGPDGAPARSGGSRRPRAVSSSYSSWGQIYDAANRSDFSGYFYIPTLDPGEQLDTLSLRAIRERTDWLYARVGAVRMLIDRTALAEAGMGVWPKWISGDEAFDKAATDAYHYAVHDPRVFSADAQQDGYSAQYAIRRTIKKSGDCFGQLLRPAPGSMMPQMHLIPGWQCENFGDELPGQNWQDGIRRNERGRPLEYCFVSTGADGKRRPQRVPADDVLHFHDPFHPGQRRGEPVLASVARKMFRREDLYHAIANGTLARERFGFALEYAPDGGGPKLPGVGGDGEDDAEKVSESGAKLSVRRLFGEQINDTTDIPELPSGASIRTIESNRPGTAVMEFQDHVLREASWAQGYPAEWVFFQAGVGQGTVAREIIVAAAEVINCAREFQMRPQFAIRHPVFFIWQLIKAGYFDRLGIKVPDAWWKTKQIMPALPTVDVGREGAMHDNRVATGKESIEAYHGEQQGTDASDVEDENLNAIQRRHKKLRKLNEELAKDGFEPLRYQDVWSRNVNIQPPMENNAGGSNDFPPAGGKSPKK